MAILCLARDLSICSAGSATSSSPTTPRPTPVYCRDIKADGAMTVLLKDAMQPNLVQTLENNPAFVHGGPFANIAHGCNSVIATKTALKLADYVVTEAGFGADLGAEKFFDIKCRKAGLPRRGGDRRHRAGDEDERRRGQGRSRRENVAAVTEGLRQSRPPYRERKKFGVPVVVAINRFVTDTEAEIAGGEGLFVAASRRRGDPLQALGQGLGRHRGAGQKVVEMADSGGVPVRAALSRRDGPLFEKIETVAKRIYRADEVIDGQGDPRPAQGLGGRRASATCRSAWPRPSIPSPPTRRCAARRPASPGAARSAAVGGRGLRRGDLRRDHDHAGPAAAASPEPKAAPEPELDRAPVYRSRRSFRSAAFFRARDRR
jgi:formyltetrahydrofolate synthetase